MTPPVETPAELPASTPPEIPAVHEPVPDSPPPAEVPAVHDPLPEKPPAELPATEPSTVLDNLLPPPPPPPVPVLPPQPVPSVPPAPQSPDLSRIAQDLQIRKAQVEAVVSLLDEGNTVPFITRYRKERTGAMNEEQIRRVQARVHALRQLADRKLTVLKSIAGQGRLNDGLVEAIFAADHPKRLEDLYLPFKPKKRSLAGDARERGLEPLALAIWTRDEAVAKLDEVLPGIVDPWKQLHDVNDVVTGVKHILAELVNEHPDVRGSLRAFSWDTAVLASTKIETVPEGKGQEFREYFAFKEPVRQIPPHRTLAVNRGEKENIIRVRFEVDTAHAMDIAANRLELGDHPHRDLMLSVVEDAIARLLLPSLEREIRRDLTDRAQEHAVHVFARNLRGLLMQPPLRGRRVLAIDPGLRTGCKVAVLDETGALLEESVIFPHQPQKKLETAKRKLEQLIRKHQTGVIAIGNGTACRETEHLVSDLIAEFAHRKLHPTPTVSTETPVTSHDVPASVPQPAETAGEQAVSAPAEHHVAVEELPTMTTMTFVPSPLGDLAATVTTGTIDLPAETSLHASTEATLPAESIAAHAVAAEHVPVAAVVVPPAPAAPVIDLTGLPEPPEDLAYVIVNEAGASDYSASPIAKEEFPTLDATARGTVSIGRRLQDPLAELVKIDPQHVGVGLYQHDLRPKHLKESLEHVIESCVNHVGVDVNTASVPLLRHVSGLNMLAARELVEYRKANGPFKTRENLKAVPQMGEARFTQAAGFLKVIDGDDPLDRTWIHPESYALARITLAELGFGPKDLLDKARTEALRAKLNNTDLAALATKLSTTEALLDDIFAALARPGRDPREELPPPIFKTGVLKLEDVTPGMELKGTVLNVVPFGAFIDIGVKESGLVHISQMANRYIKSPYDVVSVGDVVVVWVIEVKAGDKKISLSMIAPGTPRGPQEQRRPDRPMQDQRPDDDRPRQPPRGDRPPQQQQDRGPRPQQQGDRGGPPPRGPFRGAPKRFGNTPPQQQPQESAPTAVTRTPPRPKAPVKLTDEKKTGKAALNTFGELFAFFKDKDEPANEEPKADKPGE